MKSGRLQRVSTLVDRMVGPGDPNRASGFQKAIGLLNPSLMEDHVFGRPRGLIPFALVHRRPSTRVHGEPAIRKKVRWVDENHVEGFRRSVPHDFQSVSL